MSKQDETIDILSSFNTSGDLWLELQRSFNPANVIINIQPNKKYTFRFLGPFMAVDRFYVKPLEQIVHSLTEEEILAIGNADLSVIKKAKGFIRAVGLDGRSTMTAPCREAMNCLEGLETSGPSWQRCVMTNAYVKDKEEGSIAIVPLTPTLCKSIIEVVMINPDIKISGLNARDIIVLKKGRALKSNFEITMSPSNTFLNHKQTNYVIEKGLLDIPTVLQKINAKKTSVYHYKIKTGYKMPNELMQCLIEDFNGVEENEHIQQAENDFEQLPPDAFEERSARDSAIGSLDV